MSENPFEGMKIKQITVISGVRIAIYDAGKNGLDKILDKSLEFENSYTPIYWGVDKDGKVLKVIENCPVDITYEKETP